MVRAKPYIAFIADAEGDTHEYLFEGTTRRGVRRDVREWVERTDWAVGIVAIERAVAHGQKPRGRRLVRVASVTFAVSGITIAATMIIGLSLEGALGPGAARLHREARHGP